MIMGLAVSFTSCSSDDDSPIDPTPKIPVANKTIADILALVDGDVAVKITEDIIFEGTVVSNQLESNNFYRVIYVQNGETAIKISCTKASAGDHYYESFKMGDKIIFKAKDSYVANYKGTITLGESEAVGDDARYLVTSYTDEKLREIATKGNEPTAITPKIITIGDLTDAMVGTLVKIENIQFMTDFVGSKLGVAMKSEEADWSNYNRSLIQKNRKTIVLRTSKSASFAEANIAEESGSITAILGKYGSTYQLYLRKAEELSLTANRFDLEVIPNSFENPFTAEQAIATNSGDQVWVKGYIVGVLSGTGSGAFEAPFTVHTNLLIASDANETDVAKCLSVQLPTGKVRTDINIKDNAVNHKKEVLLRGNLEAYYGQPGIKSVDAYKLGEETFIPIKAEGFFVEQFNGDLGEFTQFSVSGDQVWAHNSGAAKMSGYSSGATFANEDWLISPKVSLVGKTAAKLIAVYKASLYGAEWSTCSIVVSTDYDGNTANIATATWTALEGFNGVDGGYKVELPAGFQGKEIYYAFKYTCNAEKSVNWQIQETSITE